MFSVGVCTPLVLKVVVVSVKTGQTPRGIKEKSRDIAIEELKMLKASRLTVFMDTNSGKPVLKNRKMFNNLLPSAWEIRSHLPLYLESVEKL
ncbi:hypothetical protein PanWU01x14_342660, partial [Parasponia andersonii]